MNKNIIIIIIKASQSSSFICKCSVDDRCVLHQLDLYSSLFTLDKISQSEDIAGGFAAMAAERRNWLSDPSRLVRAARHYEGAAQILIRHAVMSGRKVSAACDTKI